MYLLSVENQPALLQYLHNPHTRLDVPSSPSSSHFLLIYLPLSSSPLTFLDLLLFLDPHTSKDHDDDVAMNNMEFLVPSLFLIFINLHYDGRSSTCFHPNLVDPSNCSNSHLIDQYQFLQSIHQQQFHQPDQTMEFYLLQSAQLWIPQI